MHKSSLPLPRPPNKSGAEAAVAIILSLITDHTVLLLRRVRNPQDPWSGHYAFPGGRRERSDQDLYRTCLRETREETGIVLKEQWCRKTLPIRAAGRNVQAPVAVQPYLFELDFKPDVMVEEKEIDSYYWLELHRFKNPQNHVRAEILPGRFFPAYPLMDYYIWGFTYLLLSELFPVAPA